jgi:anthrone oxygenase-like protein
MHTGESFERPALRERPRDMILLAFEVFTVFLTAVTTSLALAHALEYPGKLRLDEQTYTAVQAIYYPGFTIGGIAEPVAALAVLVLLVIMRDRNAQLPWLLSAFIALLAMHVVFWSVTQPVNRYWLKDQKLSEAGAKFFDTEHTNAPDRSGTGITDWRSFRNRWEYSHMVRAFLSAIAFIAITVVIATR